MPRYRSSLRPVNRIKHVVDAEGVALESVNSVVDLIATTDTPTVAATTACETASKVHGIYLKLEALHFAGAGRPNFYMYIYKNVSNSLPTSVNPKAVGASVLKKYVIHQEMIMGGADLTQGLPRVVFNGVVKIPKHYQRNGPNDKLQMMLRAGTAAVTFNWCMQCHYKEFR